MDLSDCEECVDLSDSEVCVDFFFLDSEESEETSSNSSEGLFVKVKVSSIIMHFGNFFIRFKISSPYTTDIAVKQIPVRTTY